MNASNKNFILGLLSGMVLMICLVILSRTIFSKPFMDRSHLLVEMDGASLSRTELEKRLQGRLIPIKNDEYQTLSRGIENWLEEKLIEKEAKAKRTTSQNIYTQELWKQVKVSKTDLMREHKKNPSFQTQSFEEAKPLLMKYVRNLKYAKIKKNYLKNLREKYHVRIHLKQPPSYVPGLGFDYKPAKAAKPSQPTPAPGVPPIAIVPKATAADHQGRPSVGPANAPITLIEFSDFHCPFCKAAAPTIDQLMKNYPGKIRRIWRHFPLPMHPGADKTHTASECAFEQGKFWEFHDKIFQFQGQFNEAVYEQLAGEIGLDKSKFQACISSDKSKAAVQQDVAKATEMGITGAPSFLFNGRKMVGAEPYENFSRMVEGILDPRKASAFPQAPPSRPRPPMLPPPPTNVTFTDLKGRPSEGPENALVTLVIFSDFHCPFCKRVEPTIDQLMEKYKGSIRKVWRHNPLPFHPGADRTHAASECAHEQGKFWPYHKELFANMEARDDASLTKFAETAGLDKKKFDECFKSGRTLTVVKNDLKKGAEVGVSGTPSVFVGGDLVIGAKPFEDFDAAVKSKLEKAKS